jgi:hypothetical protein
MKWTAAIAIVLSLTVSAVFLIDNQILRTVLALVGVYAVWFVFSRPTRETDAVA